MPDMSKLYNGKGVVAMPSEPMSFERLHRGGDEISVSSGGSRYGQYRIRSRSRSNGRPSSGSISRSRDIVQEVYDKMGVNYVRGQHTSLETLITNTKGLGANQRDTRDVEVHPTTPRSILRTHDFGSANGNNKTPPLPHPSRGRLSQQWPPPGPMDEPTLMTKTNATSDSNIKKSRFDRMSLPSLSPAGASPSPQAEMRDIDDNRKLFAQNDDDRDTTSVVSSKSVKERINMYRASASGNRSQSHDTNFKKHPDKINLYATPSIAADGPKPAEDVAIEIDQSSCISVMKNEHPSNNSVSRLSVGDARLSAIHRSTNQSSGNTVSGGTVAKKISVVEIPHGEMQGHDAGSAASSVSGEDFLSASPRRRSHRSITGKSNSGYVEKMVEERVLAQVAVLNRKVDAEIRRIENRIDQECKARIEALEKRNQELVDLLARNGIIPM
jgi:hypothetical protein